MAFLSCLCILGESLFAIFALTISVSHTVSDGATKTLVLTLEYLKGTAELTVPRNLNVMNSY